MSDAKKPIPEIGQTVWLKVTCENHDSLDEEMPWMGRLLNDAGVFWPHRDNAWLPDPLPTATPRQPWDVLKEAADILGAHSCALAKDITLGLANQLERRATPPDPLDTLRKIYYIGLGPDKGSAQWQIDAAREIARRCLAAHDAKLEAN